MKDDRVDALDDIVRYCGTDRDAFFTDRMRQDATLRKLQVIGQAVKNLSNHTKALQPEIPWKQIAGMRDLAIELWRSKAGQRCGGTIGAEQIELTVGKVAPVFA